MKPLMITLFLFGFNLASVYAADEKDDANAKKIVGKWEVTKAQGVPPGTVMEFTKDNKVIIHVDAKGKQLTFPIGTYKVEKDKVTLMSMKDKKKDDETNKIEKLTDEEMILVDPEGKKAEFKKKK